METDYISRESVEERLTRLESESHHNSVLWPGHVEECREAIRDIPAADVKPVVRGYWKPVRESEISGYDPELSGQDPIYMHICSNCGSDGYLDENGEELLTAFCPMCGAAME